MRLLKQALAVLGALTAFAAVAAVVTPKATHALTAALVEVENTTANPVLTISLNAHNSFVAQNHCNFNGEFCTVSPVYTVPAGQTAVLDSVTALCFISAGTAPVGLRVDSTGPDGQLDDLYIPAGPVVGGAFLTGQNITTYAAGGPRGSAVVISAVTNNIDTSGDCRLGISGHLEPQ